MLQYWLSLPKCRNDLNVRGVRNIIPSPVRCRATAVNADEVGAGVRAERGGAYNIPT